MRLCSSRPPGQCPRPSTITMLAVPVLRAPRGFDSTEVPVSETNSFLLMELAANAYIAAAARLPARVRPRPGGLETRGVRPALDRRVGWDGVWSRVALVGVIEGHRHPLLGAGDIGDR